MMEWISVEDRLPLESNHYLLLHNYQGKTSHGVGMWWSQKALDENKWIEDKEPHFGTINAGRVTHWMPLPEPPC